MDEPRRTRMELFGQAVAGSISVPKMPAAVRSRKTDR